MKTVLEIGLIWKQKQAVVVHPYSGFGIHLPEAMWGA